MVHKTAVTTPIEYPHLYMLKNCVAACIYEGSAKVPYLKRHENDLLQVVGVWVRCCGQLPTKMRTTQPHNAKGPEKFHTWM